MEKQLTRVKHVVSLYAFLLVVWGFYRAIFKLPEEIEELILKPLIWLLPTFWLVKKERLGLASIGWTTRNLQGSLLFGFGMGLVFAGVAAVVNVSKYGGLDFSLPAGVPIERVPLFSAALISLATAISEETVFRGFIFSRLWKGLGSELWANMVSTIGWSIIHIPVLIFVYKLAAVDIALSFVLTGLFGFGSAIIFARTGNILSSIILHVFWSWPIILFR